MGVWAYTAPCMFLSLNSLQINRQGWPFFRQPCSTSRSGGCNRSCFLSANGVISPSVLGAYYDHSFRVIFHHRFVGIDGWLGWLGFLKFAHFSSLLGRRGACLPSVEPTCVFTDHSLWNEWSGGSSISAPRVYSRSLFSWPPWPISLICDAWRNLSWSARVPVSYTHLTLPTKA